MIRFVVLTYPPCWVLKARIQKHWGKSLLFHDKCPGFFYMRYTTHGTYSLRPIRRDEAIMVKCLAQGHKRRDRPVKTISETSHLCWNNETIRFKSSLTSIIIESTYLTFNMNKIWGCFKVQVGWKNAFYGETGSRKGLEKVSARPDHKKTQIF